MTVANLGNGGRLAADSGVGGGRFQDNFELDVAKRSFDRCGSAEPASLAIEHRRNLNKAWAIHFTYESLLRRSLETNGQITTASIGLSEEERGQQPFAGDLFVAHGPAKGLPQPEFGG